MSEAQIAKELRDQGQRLARIEKLLLGNVEMTNPWLTQADFMKKARITTYGALRSIQKTSVVKKIGGRYKYNWNEYQKQLK